MNWTEILVALIAAGLLTYAANVVKWLAARRRQSNPEARQVLTITTVDQSLAVVARARDELEAQNALLSALLAESRAYAASRESDLIQRHNAERVAWDLERTTLRGEIADLERRLREMLKEVENLRLRTS